MRDSLANHTSRTTTALGQLDQADIDQNAITYTWGLISIKQILEIFTVDERTNLIADILESSDFSAREFGKP